MMGGRTLVIVAVVVLMSAVWLYEPIPKGTSDPWKLRLKLAVGKISRTISRGIPKLGISNPRDVHCWIMGMMSPTGPDPLELGSVSITNEKVDGVELRVYQPKSTNERKLRPGMVHLHAGGWVFTKPYHYDLYLAQLAETLDMVIASVDYRSAPQHIFPAAFDDSYNVVCHFLMNAAKYGIDSSRIAIGGESAGGNMAAAVALKLRDEKFSKQPKLQLLRYPVLQAIDFRLPSYIQNAEGPMLSAELMAWCWSMYVVGDDRYALAFLNNTHTSSAIKQILFKTHLDHNKLKDYQHAGYELPNLDHGDLNIWSRLQDIMLDPYFAPLIAKDLSNLPRAYVVTSHYDVLRDDGLLYVTRLRDAGIDVTHNHLTEGIHQQLMFKNMKETLAAEEHFEKYLKENL